MCKPPVLLLDCSVYSTFLSELAPSLVLHMRLTEEQLQCRDRTSSAMHKSPRYDHAVCDVNEERCREVSEFTSTNFPCPAKHELQAAVIVGAIGSISTMLTGISNLFKYRTCPPPLLRSNPSPPLAHSTQAPDQHPT